MQRLQHLVGLPHLAACRTRIHTRPDHDVVVVVVVVMVGCLPPASDVTAAACLETMELAARYDIPRLRALCEANITNGLTIESVCSLARTAHRLGAEDLESRCIRFLVANMEALADSADFQQLAAHCSTVLLRVVRALASTSGRRAETAEHGGGGDAGGETASDDASNSPIRATPGPPAAS